jgi:hypothetical protein
MRRFNIIYELYVSHDMQLVVEWSWRLRLPDADFVAVASALGAGECVLLVHNVGEPLK